MIYDVDQTQYNVRSYYGILHEKRHKNLRKSVR